MVEKLRWGILSTGAIARRFATDLRESRSGKLVAVGSRSADTAEAFGRDFSLSYDNTQGTYQKVLDDEDVDAVYIATPHPNHVPWVVRAAEAGKHILCEKPIGLNLADAAVAVEAARRHGVFLMEAFMYRCHPQTAKVLELLRSGVTGELRVIEAVHSFKGSSDARGRLLANDLGGGGILDVGCYCMSMARLVAGVALGADVAIEPIHVSGAAHIGPTGVDEWAVGSLKFDGGIIAHLATGVQVDQGPRLALHGSEGSISVVEPWLPGLAPDPNQQRQHILAGRGGKFVAGTPLFVYDPRPLYAIEADHVAECIARGDLESDAMPLADTLGNMAALDRWRDAVGVVYERERPASLVRAAHGRPLSVRKAALPAGEIAGVSRPVSKVVLGTMLAEGDRTWPMAMAVFDEFFERGGNAFDSARRYGEGESDRALGHWLRTRGVRDEVVVIAKGAHTPHCDPETLTRELLESLEDLQTDRADMYFLHRDNLEVPVGEFVDVLNEHHGAGRIGAFGGSNWAMGRVDAANAYAAEHGLVGFTVLSNQFSLARMVSPTFPGCETANTPAFREWMARTRIACVAWSSQAAGFFTGGDSMGLGHAWDDQRNFTRRERAMQLASDRGSTAMTVALAWVLGQPLPIFPIIGPRTLSELRTSLDAFDLELSDKELRWLDLEDD